MAAIAAASSSVATEGLITLEEEKPRQSRTRGARLQESARSDTHRLLRFVTISLFLPGVETFRCMARRKTGSMPRVISWGYDRCVFFGAGA